MLNLRAYTVVGIVAGQVLVFGQTGDVSKILGDVRQALGGEKKLASIKTVTVTGKAQRTNAMGASVEQEFEMAMELPDKFMRRDVLANLGNMSIYRTMGFNGDGLIFEVDQPPQLAGGGNIVMRFAGPGGPDGAATPEQQAAVRRGQLLTAKQDFTRLALAMFGQSFAAYPLTMTHAGQAEAPDGKADVIDLKGDGNFNARLFVDTQSHMPLMLSWMDREPIVRTMTRDGRGGGAPATTVVGGHGGAAVVGGGGGGGATVAAPPGGQRGAGARELTPEDREKMQKDMELMRAEAANRPMVEFRLIYMDYREVDGVMLPHKLQRTVAGKPTEEITFERVRINQKVDPKKFTVTK